MKTPAASAKLVVLISGRGSNLRSLVAAAADGRLDCGIAGVVSNRPDASGLAWAAGQGIATRLVDHRAYAERAAFDQALANAVQDLADAVQDVAHAPSEARPAAATPWVVLAGFMRILGESFVSRYSGRIVNIHPSLLPLYPGLHTHRQALDDGALLHGATVHLVTAALDRGPILAQAIVPVLRGDTESALADRVLTMEHRLYPLAMQWLAAGRISLDGGCALLDGSDAADRRVLLHSMLAEPSATAGLAG